MQIITHTSFKSRLLLHKRFVQQGVYTIISEIIRYYKAVASWMNLSNHIKRLHTLEKQLTKQLRIERTRNIQKVFLIGFFLGKNNKTQIQTLQEEINNISKKILEEITTKLEWINIEVNEILRIQPEVLSIINILHDLLK